MPFANALYRCSHPAVERHTPSERLSHSGAPPPPPPRGFSDSRDFGQAECERLGGKRAVLAGPSSKSHHLQKYYKGARPREAGYQINV